MDPDATVPHTKADQGDAVRDGLSPSEVANLLGAGIGPTSERPSFKTAGWQPPPVEDLQAALPQYEIDSFIARGGMGAVYRGMQRSLKRPVAIKVLPPDVDDGDLQFGERFKREAQAMARLSHPNVVAVFDAGETAGGLLYFVMEYIEGTDLAQIIASEERLDPRRVVDIISGVCAALAFAHEEGIVHRDIKPSNVMIDRKGRVKVADFGLAKTFNIEHTMLTRSDMALGTPDFVAPEALTAGVNLDGRADLYAVGVMLYQMLTGKIPRGRFELPSGVVPELDRRFDAIVDRAMQTDREKRYSTATELRLEAESVVMREGNAGTPGLSDGAAATAKKKAGKSARAPFLVFGGVLAVLGLGAYFLTRGPEEAGGEVHPTAPGAAAPGAATPAAATPDITAPAKPAAATPAAALPSAPYSDDPTASGVWTDHLKETKWEAPWVLENGVLRAPSGGTIRDLGKYGDCVLRIRARALQKSNLKITVQLRANLSIPGNRDFLGGYLFQLNTIWSDCQLDFAERFLGQGDTERGTSLWRGHPIPADLDLNQEVEWEIRAVGDELSLRANGRLIRSARDSRLRFGHLTFLSESGVEITGLETMDLGPGSTVPDPPAVVPPPLLPRASSSSITATTTEAPFINSLGMKFVPVPIPSGPSAGKTILFSIWETRVQDFQAMRHLAERTPADPGFAQEPTHPAVMVDRRVSREFCAWLTGHERQAGILKTGQRYRLPTDHEWSCAAGIGNREDAAQGPGEKDGKLADFPWGTGFPPPERWGNYWSEELRPLLAAGTLGRFTGELPGYRDGFATTAPVGSYAANPFGLHDLGGNVSEWCDGFERFSAEGILRGASWRDAVSGDLLSAKRFLVGAEEVGSHIGFRCVLEVDDPAAVSGAGAGSAASPGAPASEEATAVLRK